MAPHQQVGEVVQQGGRVDHRCVVVHAVHREAEREAGGAVGAAQRLAQAVERLGLVGEPVFHGRLRAEGAEERADAHHHQRGDHGLGVGDHARAAVGAGVGQQLERHQRVAGDQLAEAVRVNQVFVGAQGLQCFGGFGEHGNVGAEQVRGPRGKITRRVVQHGGVG